MGYKVNKRYVGTKQVRPVWKPGSDTLFYYPLTENANDYSGNNNNGTASNVTFSSENGAYCRGGYSAGSNGVISTPTLTMGTVYTINCWIKSAGTLTGNKEITICRRWSPSNRYYLVRVNGTDFAALLGNGGTLQGSTLQGTASIGTTWHNVCVVRNGTNISVYLDNNLILSGDGGYSVDPQYFNVGNDTESDASYSANSYVKDYIMEKKIWSAQEISDYYNQTKSKYGL